MLCSLVTMAITNFVRVEFNRVNQELFDSSSHTEASSNQNSQTDSSTRSPIPANSSPCVSVEDYDHGHDVQLVSRQEDDERLSIASGPVVVKGKSCTANVYHYKYNSIVLNNYSGD